MLPSHERLALDFGGFHAIAVEDSKADMKMLQAPYGMHTFSVETPQLVICDENLKSCEE